MITRNPARRRILRRAVAEGLEARQLLSASYTITDLGTLPGGTYSVAIAINASGEAVGYSDTDGSGNHDHAVLWTANGIQDLGTLPGDVFSHAEAINSAGDVVGYSRDSQGNDSSFLWTPSGGMVDLGISSSQAFGINDSNQVVGQATVSGGDENAYIWTQSGGATSLGTLETDGSSGTSFATAINANGDVVGSAELDNGDQHAFLWTSAGGMQDLGTLFGEADSVAYGINNSDQVAGYSGDDFTFAFLWTPGGTDGLSDNPQMVALDSLGGTFDQGDFINNAGQVVGFSEDPVSQYDEASIWQDDLSSVDDLNFDIPVDSNWGLDEAFAINDSGLIVGSGESPSGDEHGFLLTPLGLAGPGAFVFAPDVTVVGQTETVDVFYYSDTSSIDTSTLDSSNITANAPDGSALAVTYTGVTPGDGFLTATYQVTAPDGIWNAADTGTYSVTVVPGSVKDINGAGVSTDNTTFDCNLTIDSSFGDAAKGVDSVTLPFTAEQVLQESNGNVLSIGHRGQASDNTLQGVLESITSTNTIDPTFATGTKGVVMTPTGANDAFYGGAIQADGKIVAVGAGSGMFLVARYNTDGSLDTTFGNGGFATADFGADDPATASSVVIESDGSILVGGVANGVMAVARFTSAGQLDGSFNPGGAADAAFPSGGERTVNTGAVSTLNEILLQPDGKILGVGNDGTVVAVFRLNADGTSDGTFAAGGIAVLAPLASQSADHSPNAESLALQPSGAILVAGQSAGGGLGVVRLTSGGLLDPTFSGGGFVNVSFGGANDRADDVVVSPGDGAFILVGTTDAAGVSQTAIAAFNSDGSINTAFGLNGKTTFDAASARTPAPGTTSGGTTHQFHPQLFDFATATMQADGHILISNTNQAAAAIRRIQPFTSTTAPVVNSFGKIGRKNVKLAPFDLANGTVVTITLSGGGSATESQSGNDVTLTLNGPAAVTIKTKGGTGALNLAAVSVNGKLLSFNAPSATLTGRFSISGTAGNITLGAVSGMLQAAGSVTSLTVGNISGTVSCGGILRTAKLGSVTGTIAAGISIANITLGTLSGATLLAGTNLGADGLLGGTGANADIYGSGQILNMKVTGTIANSFIGAGVNPVDGTFGNGNDAMAGTGTLRALTVKGSVDQATHFEATLFPRFVHLPAKVSPAADARFIVV